MDAPPQDEKRYRDNMIRLTSVIIEVLTFQDKRRPNSTVNPFVTYAENFKGVSSKANAKMSLLHVPFFDVFNLHRASILGSDGNPLWAVTKAIDVHFGKGGKWHKKNYILKIGAAFYKASTLRAEADKKIADTRAKGTENENETQATVNQYWYLFNDLLHYYLLEVIADALGVEHQDYDAVKSLSSHFCERSHLRAKSPASDEKSDEDDIGHKLGKVTGGGIGGKKINAAIRGMTSEGGILDNIDEMMTKVQDTPKTGDKKADMLTMLANLLPNMADTMETVTSMLGKEESAEDN